MVELSEIYIDRKKNKTKNAGRKMWNVNVNSMQQMDINFIWLWKTKWKF